jgi:hypothetical protein
LAGNPYAPPKSDVGTGAAGGSSRKPTAAARFLWTACIGFPVFLSFVFFAPHRNWVYGAIGSAAFATFAGLIALCIPVRSKLLFVVPSIFACIFIAYLIGSSR